VLAERVKAAAEALTGLTARVTPNRLEIHFADEHDLVQLAESLDVRP
jgi:hypothetical protein